MEHLQNALSIIEYFAGNRAISNIDSCDLDSNIKQSITKMLRYDIDELHTALNHHIFKDDIRFSDYTNENDWSLDIRTFYGATRISGGALYRERSAEVIQNFLSFTYSRAYRELSIRLQQYRKLYDDQDGPTVNSKSSKETIWMIELRFDSQNQLQRCIYAVNGDTIHDFSINWGN